MTSFEDTIEPKWLPIYNSVKEERRNEISKNYYIIPAISDIADDKLKFMVDLEERYYFFDIPALITDSGASIIKKAKTRKIV